MSQFEDLINVHCPNGVEFKCIGEIADCYSGATPASGVSDFWDNGTIPWMSSGEVNKGTVYDTDKTITQAGFDSCSTKMVPANAVVIALAGQGKTRGTVARTRIPLCTNQSLCSLVVRDGAVDSDFLYYYLTTQYKQLRNVSSGDGTRGGLNLQMIRSYRAPIPPLTIQQRIVKVLDNFTKLEAELEAELEARRVQYKYYRDALLSFDEKKQVGVRWMMLNEIGKFIRGRRFTKADYVDDGISVIHYGEIYTHYGTSASSVLSHVRPDMAATLRYAKPGDVVITDVGETVEDVGKAVAWVGDEDVAIHDHCYAFRHSMNPKFIAYCMQTTSFIAEKAKYVARTKVNTLLINGFSKIRIPVPPVEEQERIVSILDKMDALVNDLSVGLPAEINARRRQYEYYRDHLLAFREAA
jgi:type I restriction enzyme S subunit